MCIRDSLHSHLLNLGLACHFTGFDSGFMQFFRVRETSMKMAEILTGARKTYGLNLIGGIRRDLLKDDMIQTRQLAQQMRREVQELVDVLLSTPNMEPVSYTHLDVYKRQHTRLPTFSINRIPLSSSGRRGAASAIICASRWQPLPVFT